MTPMRGAQVLGLVSLTVAAIGCGGAPGPAQARAEAQKIWDGRCLNCHGRNGAGDGPQARLLDTKPRQLNDYQWQATVTDAHLRQVIVEGGQVVGKSPLMAANPDLASKPEVVDALVAHIRSL